MVVSSGKRRRPERSHAATMATTAAFSSGSTTDCRAAMTSYSVVVTRVGASSVLIAGVESLSLWCIGNLPPGLGVACAGSCALDIYREEQKTCQAAVASGQGSRWGKRHAVLRASTTQRRAFSVRRAVEASHSDTPPAVLVSSGHRLPVLSISWHWQAGLVHAGGRTAGICWCAPARGAPTVAHAYTPASTAATWQGAEVIARSWPRSRAMRRRGSPGRTGAERPV